MAKLKMLKIGVCGLQEDRKRILEKMQRLGVVEIETLKNEEDGQKPNTAQKIDSFTNTINVLTEAVEILDEYCEYKPKALSGYRGRPVMGNDEFEAILERGDRNIERCYGIVRNKKRIEEERNEIVRLGVRIDALRPWTELDVTMRYTGTRKTKAFVGTLPGLYDEQGIGQLLAQREPTLEKYDVQVVGQLTDSTCVFVLVHESEADKAEETLRSLGFARPQEMSKTDPTNCTAQLNGRIDAANERIKELEEKIIHYAPRRELFCKLLDYYTIRKEKYEMLDRLHYTRHVFMLEGWVPLKAYETLKTAIEPLGAFVEEIEQTKKDETPTALKNGAITEGGETVVKLYSMPSKADIDPTPIMAIFYYMLFGLMLGDAVYGLLMVLACGGVLLFLRPEGDQRRNMKLFMFSGLCAVFWGVVFGSYCGDLPNVIARTFHGATENVIEPLWFDPVADPVSMLLFSVGLGIVHVFTGLLLGVVTRLKNKDFMGALADSFSWILLLGGAITAGLNAVLEVFGRGYIITVPPIAQKIGVICMGIGALLVLFLSGHSKNPIKQVLKGAYNLYGVTSYLSDFLSYSRILALALATGVISQVFNTIASMFGGGTSGTVIMVIVCLIGHALNIAISLIGCYVHTCRLQYVEFFGKFYEGGGRVFSPFSAKTKTFKFEEEKEL